jgi:hypothetical protein
MALREVNYATATFDDPEWSGGSLTSDEIIEKMGETNFEHRHAIKELKKIELEKNIKESKTTLIIHAQRSDLLQNPEARKLFEDCMEDPKFKATVDFVNSLVYVEHQAIMEKYKHYEMIAKRAERQYEQLCSMLIWEQSKNKREGQELMSMSGGALGS